MSPKKNQSKLSQEFEDSWQVVCQALAKKYGQRIMQNWINKLTPYFNETDDSIKLLAPNSFIRDWINIYYLDFIQRTWLYLDPSWGNRYIKVDLSKSTLASSAMNRSEFDDRALISNTVADVDMLQTIDKVKQIKSDHSDTQGQKLQDSICTNYNSNSNMVRRYTEDNAKNNANSIDVLQYTSNCDSNDGIHEHILPKSKDGSALPTLITTGNNFVGIDDRFNFDNFVVDSSNELAYNALHHAAESKRIVYNPLFIYGDVGLGKTHLMHALGNYLRQHQDCTRQKQKKVMYMTAEGFMYEFVTALRLKNAMSFKQKFRSFNVLMIDDIQFIAGKESTQNEFFHTFNALFDNRCQIVISADRFPAALKGIEERIKSRLGGGLVLYIKPANYELRLAILQHKLDKINQFNQANNLPQVSLDKSVTVFLANSATSIRELEGGLNRILAYNDLCKKSINIDSVREILSDLVQIHQRMPTVEEVKYKVAERYGIKFTDLSSGKRFRQIVRPRQVAIYLCKKFTNQSLNSLGKQFGGRDHTTIKHAISVIDKLILREQELLEDVRSLSNVLRSRYSDNI